MGDRLGADTNFLVQNDQPPKSTQPGHPSWAHAMSIDKSWATGTSCDALAPYLWYCSVNWCLAES